MKQDRIRSVSLALALLLSAASADSQLRPERQAKPGESWQERRLDQLAATSPARMCEPGTGIPACLEVDASQCARMAQEAAATCRALLDKDISRSATVTIGIPGTPRLEQRFDDCHAEQMFRERTPTAMHACLVRFKAGAGARK